LVVGNLVGSLIGSLVVGNLIESFGNFGSFVVSFGNFGSIVVFVVVVVGRKCPGWFGIGRVNLRIGWTRRGRLLEWVQLLVEE
jgi:hypothetical protein